MADLKRLMPNVAPGGGGPGLPMGNELSAPANALAGLGQTIANVGEKLQNELDVDAKNKALNEIQQVHNNLYLKYQNDTDYNTMPNRYAADLDAQKAAILDKPFMSANAKEYVQAVYDSQRTSGLFKMEELARGHRHDSMRADYVKAQSNLEQAVTDGQLDPMEAITYLQGIINDTVATGMVTQEDGAKDLSQATKSFASIAARTKAANDKIQAEAIKNGIIQDAWGKAKDAETQQKGAGMVLLNDMNNFPELKNPDRNELISRLDYFAKQQVAIGKEANDKIEQATRSDFNKTISNLKVTVEELSALKDRINTSSMVESEKTPMLKAVNEYVGQIAKGKTVESNPQVKAQLLRDLYDTSLPRKDYISYVNKAFTDGNLSNDDYTEFIGKEATTSPLKKYQSDAIGKSILDARETLVISVLGTDESALETIMRLREKGASQQADRLSNDRQAAYDNLHLVEQQLRDYITKNPDATEADIYIQSRKAIAIARQRTVKQIKSSTDFSVKYDSLPSGSIYTAPDGTQRRKK